jgi:hypothetical protein
MKTFAQFIKEAVETLASTEAKNRGLVGNGHGDWYDKQGNFVAKTVNGKLKYYGQGDTSSKDGIPGEELKTNKTKQKIQSNQQVQDAEKPQEQNGVVVVFGRFNPPSKLHEPLLKAGFSQAKRRGFEYRVYPSRIQDGTANPLNPAAKISYLQRMFPEYSEYVVDSEESKTIFDVLGSLYGDGYSDVVIVAGQDRMGEFQSLAHKGEGDQYQFNNLEVIPSGVKDPDSEVENPSSSAMMRTAAAVGDFEKFSTGLPPKMKRSEKEEIFAAVSKSMKVTEETELWKIAPELDFGGMRWDYKHNGLFQVGSIVENLNTGLVGQIIRRGSNHLICVTEDGVMFKSWLKDVREVYEIGTTEYREYVQSITPGQDVESYVGDNIKPTVIKQINKNSKKSSRVK